MSDRKWIWWPEHCPDCGCNAEVLTDADQDPMNSGEPTDPEGPFADEGDVARCGAQCGATGSISVYDEDAVINWKDDE